MGVISDAYRPRLPRKLQSHGHAGRTRGSILRISLVSEVKS